jgi:hypothetical protein
MPERTMILLWIARDVNLALASLALLVGVIVNFATRPTAVTAVEGRDLSLR